MIPGFSLIDVLRCADHPELLRKVFADRVVFVGTVLPEEDRKTSSDRFLLAAEASSPPPGGAACALSPLSLSAPATGTVPGVYVHAAAADAVLRNREVRRLPLWGIALLTAASALLASAAGFVLGPGRAVAATGLLLAALFAASVGLLSLRLWMPVSLPGAAAVLAVAAAYAGRYLIEDRRRRQVQDAFGHYVSPTIVRRMVETGTQPRLGGERREVTIMFADLSGFTALSGQIGPEDLMEVTNRYLALVVKAVEATGGYVDKFIGDAVMAMWGAPADDPDHAVNALAAACLAARDVEAERLAALAKGRIGFAIKIGLNSGPATVGNVGSDRRFNYTAVGETVNLASRLEGMPGLYDCAVVVSRSTARAVGKEYLLCELDRVSVKGVAEPLPIFMPIAPRVRASPEHQSFVAVYEAALAAYRGRDFSRAAGLWEALSYPREAGCNVIFGGPGGGPGKIMAARARSFLSGSPGPGWNGVWTVAKG
ncbi:MAG: hypothetical protein HQL33_13230 [Alphaproteobacteria bacterium]|nr:hypothetical protein [Alphaproteobacteria bacterium]